MKKNEVRSGDVLQTRPLNRDDTSPLAGVEVFGEKNWCDESYDNLENICAFGS